MTEDNGTNKPRRIRCQWCKKFFHTSNVRNDLCPECRAHPTDEGLPLREKVDTLKQYTKHLDAKLDQRITEQRAEILEDCGLDIDALMKDTDAKD